MEKFDSKSYLETDWARVNGPCGAYLVICPLFSDFFEALFDFHQAGTGSDRVDEKKGVGRGDRKSPHGRKLQIARSIQNVHLNQGNARRMKCLTV